MVRETNGIAEQSGLDERWWADSMKCHCDLRNDQDLLADGKAPCEWRFKRPVIPFGSMVEHHPISAKDRQGSPIW